MEWKNWNSLLLAERSCLPETSGIYVVVDQTDFVWYVGQASNLRDRWEGKGHHRYRQLIRTNSRLIHRIYWHPFSVLDLNAKEQHYINLFKPELNGCKVKTYLPKKPQNEREIKRLLRTLNRLTRLFPIIRSVVAGEYIGENTIRHILLLIHLNDIHLIGKSMHKRSVSIQDSWGTVETYCGKDEQCHRSYLLATYTFGEDCFEFIVMPDLITLLEENPALTEQCVGTAEILGIQVKALKTLDFLNTLQLREIQPSIGDPKIWDLLDAAYLIYRKPELKCLG